MHAQQMHTLNAAMLSPTKSVAHLPSPPSPFHPPQNTHLSASQALSLVETGSLLKPFSNDVILQFTPAFVADHTVAM